MKFEELDLSDQLLDALWDMHFDDCTPIQELAIPVALEGRDLIAVAQTGTGKTAAYLIPIIDRIHRLGAPLDAVNCIVMSPTRELAQQIDRQMEGFAYYMPVNSLAIYGGTDGATFARQQRAMREGADMVIATPGRLIALLQMGNIDLSRVQYFVLDEADRMLDMGFYDDIMQIVRQLPRERQTLMFSATMPPRIRQMAREILRDPVEVKTAVSKPAEGIDQRCAICYEPQKTPLLKQLFRDLHARRVIVFASSKLSCKELARELRRDKWKVDEMHSDLDQERRDQVMLDFRAGRTDILVATDIVARGIDIDDITMVVNYDVPHDPEDYVHRVGRTARAGADGIAVTLVGPRDQQRWGTIEKFLGTSIARIALSPSLGETPAYEPDRRVRGGSQRGRTGGSKSKNRNGGKPRNNSGNGRGNGSGNNGGNVAGNNAGNNAGNVTGNKGGNSAANNVANNCKPRSGRGNNRRKGGGKPKPQQPAS